MTNQADENQSNYGYGEPVSYLLTLGRPEGRGEDDWLNYIELYGFTAEHIPELIRLYDDETFQDKEFWEKPEEVAFVHVMRVLGQLHHDSALPFLLNLAKTEEDSDWVWEEIPSVLAQYGSAIIPQLKAAILRKRGTFILGATLVQVFEDLSKKFPETMEDRMQFLMSILEESGKNDESINAAIIHDLAQEKYTPALPLIKKAFARKRVDESYAGDWYDIQVEYGLKEPDPTRRKKIPPQIKMMRKMLGMEIDDDSDETKEKAKRIVSAITGTKKNNNDKAKKKAKRKQSQKSKKQNRKR